MDAIKPAGMIQRMTPDEASEHLGIPVKSLSNMRYRGNGPQFLKIGNVVWYEKPVLDRWLDSRRMTKTESRRRIAAARAEQHA